MKLGAIVAFLLFALSPLPTAAQSLFANPFADATTYRSERGALPDARYRARYQVTRVERGGAPVVSELVLDVADDWALVREGEHVTLYDFRLNRFFTLGANSFTTSNGLAELTFRAMERQNRSYLQRVLAVAGPEQNFADACDAEAELGFAFPGAADAAVTEVRERSGVATLQCAGRDVGGFTAGTGAEAPAAFWPTMFAALVVHPALQARVRATGHAPAQMEITYRQTPEGLSRRTWQLIAIETVSTAYPLDPSWRNATADTLDRLIGPGGGQIASDAIAGRAQGGAPTLESWSQSLRSLAREQGQPAAAMLILPSFNMFPELQRACGSRQGHYVCELAQNLRTISDPVPLALIEIGASEQSGNAAAAIAAMQRAQTSPLRSHPALGASFALALLRFNADNIAAARAANLPTDVAALQNQALLALPYNPAYWTDAGDRYARNYELGSAFLFYDVAFSLPMESAITTNPALIARRRQMERLRTDFPAAWSLTAP